MCWMVYKMLPSLSGYYQVLDPEGKDLHQLCREQLRSLQHSSKWNPKAELLIAIHRALDDHSENTFKRLPDKLRKEMEVQFERSLESQRKRQKRLSCTEMPNYAAL